METPIVGRATLLFSLTIAILGLSSTASHAFSAMASTTVLACSAALGESVGGNGFDADVDHVPDVVDNCSLTPNSDQRDTDGDGYGNACDPDLDQDCTVSFSDLGILKSLFFGNDPDADLDGDGAVSFQDLGIMKLLFFAAPGPSGLTNACG